jgi:hypothetical protein
MCHFIRGEGLTRATVSGIVAVAVCAVLALPPSAQAAVSDCTAGYACTWANDNYNQGFVFFSTYVNQTKLGIFANDTANSVASYGSYQCARFYTD